MTVAAAEAVPPVCPLPVVAAPPVPPIALLDTVTVDVTFCVRENAELAFPPDPADPPLVVPPAPPPAVWLRFSDPVVEPLTALVSVESAPLPPPWHPPFHCRRHPAGLSGGDVDSSAAADEPVTLPSEPAVRFAAGKA